MGTVGDPFDVFMLLHLFCELNQVVPLGCSDTDLTSGGFAGWWSPGRDPLHLLCDSFPLDVESHQFRGV